MKAVTLIILVLVLAVIFVSRRVRAWLKSLPRLFWEALKRSVLPLVVFGLGALMLPNATWFVRVVGVIESAVRALGFPVRISSLLPEHFFEEVAIAIMVAGVTAFLVEFNFRIREEHQLGEERRAADARFGREKKEIESIFTKQKEEIAKNVFNYLLGSLAPRWLTTQVETLYKMRLLRKEVEVSYEFEDPPKSVEGLNDHRKPDVADLLMVKMELSYHLENLTDEPVSADIRHQITPTVPLPAEYSGFTYLRIEDNEGNTIHEWKGGKDDEFVEHRSLGWKKREILVRNSISIAAQSIVKVVVKQRAIRWCNDHVAWVTRLPAEGIRVKVDRSKCPRMDFMLEESHPKPFKDAKGWSGWESAGPAIPFQGFILHWFPRPIHQEGAGPAQTANTCCIPPAT